MHVCLRVSSISDLLHPCRNLCHQLTNVDSEWMKHPTVVTVYFIIFFMPVNYIFLKKENDDDIFLDKDNSMPILCLPVGLLTTSLFLLGLLLGAIWQIGLSSSTSFEEAAYNNAVAEWGRNSKSFRENEFEMCIEGDRCVYLSKIVNGDEEGVPPTYQLSKYTAFYYETGKANDPPTEETRLLSDQHYDPNAAVTLFLRSLKNSSLRSQSLRIPLFKWRWQEKTSCNTQMGESLVGNDCIQIYVLERICITVSETSDGNWKFSGKYRNGVGCLENSESRWDPGTYTIVNSSDIINNMNTSLIGVRGMSRSGVTLPFKLPTSEWIGDFSLTKIRIRSVFDPILTFENITNGTLSLEGVSLRSPLISSFANYAIFSISMTCIAVAVSIVICLTICFPTYRKYYLFQFESEIPSPHNKLRSLSQIYM